MLRRHASQLEVVVEERTLNVVGFVPYRTCTFGWFQKETSFCENGVLPPTLTIYYPHKRSTRIYARVEEPAASTQPNAVEERDGVSTRRLLSVPSSVRVPCRRVAREPQRLVRNPAANDTTGTSSRTPLRGTPHDERLV